MTMLSITQKDILRLGTNLSIMYHNLYDVSVKENNRQMLIPPSSNIINPRKALETDKGWMSHVWMSPLSL